MKRQSELLMAFKKDEIIDATFRLGMPPIRKSAKKAEWAAYIENSMAEYGENLMLLMRQEEAELLQKHLEQGLSFRMDHRSEDAAVLMAALDILDDLGLVEWESGVCQVDARVPGWLPAEEADRAQLHLQDLLYDYMQGWLLYVGMMPAQELAARAAALTEPETDKQRADAEQLCFALLLGRGGQEAMLEADGALWIMHDELEDPEALLERLRSPHVAELTYPEFDEDALLFAATQSLVPGDLQLYRPLLDELERRGVEDADALVGDAVMMAQNEHTNDALEAILEEAHPCSLDDANKVAQLFNDLCNNLPRWWNKGHTPKELMRRTMPRRAAVMPGRNDPCPCGSGKKYKQCCGKRLQ